MGLIAAGRERAFDSQELFVWTADADGVIRAADSVFARLCGTDPVGRPLAALASPVAPSDRPGAALTRHNAAGEAVFWAMVLTVPAAGGTLGVGIKPVEQGGLVAAVAARRARHLRGDKVAMELRALLGRVGVHLAAHAELAETFARRSGFVAELADDIRLFSLNAILAAHRVSEAAAIGAVAQLMQARAEAAGPDILALRGAIEDAATRLEQARFGAAAGELLAEALLLHPDAVLAAPLADITERAVDALAALEAAFDELARVAGAVDEHLKTLRFLELQGRIEAARANDTEHVRTLFAEIGAQVRSAGAELREFVALGTRTHREGAGTARAVRELVAALR
jgi:hypothetical protein